MRILSENSILHMDSPSKARRAATIAAGLLLGIALCLGCVHARRSAATVVGENSPSAAHSAKASTKHATWHQIGLASWYGAEFQGHETANGETFNMHDLTCAHRSLPLGTWLKVTNLHTRKWIVVRVNDRGPVPDTRIVDLSAQAARMLGIRNHGVTRIRLDVIDPKKSVEIARLDKIRQARLAAQADPVEVGN